MRDYRFKLDNPPRKGGRISRLPWVALIAAPVVVAGLLGFGADPASAPHDPGATIASPPTANANPLGETTSVTLSLPGRRASPEPAPQPVAATQPTPQLKWQSLSVKKGDSLSSLFQRNGFTAAQLQRLMQSGKPASELTRVFPGDEIKVAVNGDGDLQHLIYEIAPTRILHIDRDAQGYTSQMVEKAYETRFARASGTIEDSLFAAATKAGLSERLTMELAGIFGWDVDFALDIRSGDQFSLVYEELYLDGEKVKDGRIVAAEFINQGRDFRAVLFTKPDGVSDYYSPDGRSMRKAFLRTPVDFRRISSRFTKSRCHPVLGICRPHRGVDYAASIGTPIKAAGDGKVIFAGRKGGYGRTVILKHGQRYSTLYAHMSHIARGIHSGKRVRQGQIIGYVGRSGLATGPHLHYEFRVNGVHRNPLTVKLPQAQPLEAKYHDAFQAQAAPLLAQLDLIRRFAVAEAPAKQ